MANGFGTLWVGASGLQSSQNALNVTANNVSNVNVEGYVRQQVMFADQQYIQFSTAAISDQSAGLGVAIGDVVHARDRFLDQSYRSEVGRQSFYQASYEAVDEVQTFLQEMDGEAFQGAISDLYEAFAEFAKAPGDTVNQDLVMQKCSLFLSRSQAVYDGLKDYQTIINTKIKNETNKINDLGKKIHELNLQIQKIEAADIETAMNLRDERDQALDDLGKLCKVSYKETNEGVVKVDVDGVQFVLEDRYFRIDFQTDPKTQFVTPYWPQLSDIEKDNITPVFDMTNCNADTDNDIGEIKALLLARGDAVANYSDMVGLSAEKYNGSLSTSIMMNSQAELDKLVNSVVTAINNAISPIKSYGGATVTGTDPQGNVVNIGANTLVADTENCAVGSDGKIPPQEVFKRVGVERFTPVSLADGSTVYVYNDETPLDQHSLYTLGNMELNSDMLTDPSLFAHKKQNGLIDYDLGEKLDKIWRDETYTLNPADDTPCSFQNFYTKWVGEIGTTGSIYKTTSDSLDLTSTQIDYSRQQVTGVSTDEELVNIIKYQNAYNASSRFINVVNEMIEHILTNLGH